MLDKLFSYFKHKEDVFDESFGNPKVKEFGKLLQKQQYLDCERIYHNSDWAERSLMMRGIAFSDNYHAAIQQYQKNRKNALSCLLAGSHALHLAWQARTGKRAKDVTYDEFKGFRKFLELSYEFLQSSIEHNATDPEPFAQLIRVLMGLSEDVEVIESYFKEATRLCHEHMPAHINMITVYNPKWFGSLERMYGFAKSCQQNNNTPLFLQLTDYAISEHHLYFSMNNRDEDYETFYQKPETRAMIMENYSKLKVPESGKAWMPMVRSYVAYNLYQIEETGYMWKELSTNNFYGSILPWGYAGIHNSKELRKLFR
jgi:hypothetical protein